MATTSTKVGFLNLPIELRNEIYRNLLSTKRTKRYYDLGYSSYHLDLAILGTNRQLCCEARRVYRENKFVHIRTTWPALESSIITEAKTPVIAKGSKAVEFGKYYFRLVLHCLADSNPSHYYHYILCLEDLPAFCESLYFFDCTHPGFTALLNMWLDLGNPYEEKEALPIALQQQFLMPFAILKDLDRLLITGHDTKEVENQLRNAMKIPNPTASDYLE